MVTYSASTPLRVINELPECVETDLITAEEANSIYGMLSPSSSNVITQSFSAVGWFWIDPEITMYAGATVSALWDLAIVILTCS